MIHRYEEDLHECLDQIGLMMGLLFQRADDLLDFDIRNRENKSSFKDMEEGFFNSFAVYLSEKNPEEFKTFLKNCRSLKEIKASLGEGEFESILASFDDMNKLLIEKGERRIEDLKQKLLKTGMASHRNFKKMAGPPVLETKCLSLRIGKPNMKNSLFF